MLPLFKPHRGYPLLLQEPADMTDEEKARLERIKKIDPAIFHLMQEKVEAIRKQVMALEKEEDAIIDFLNGEIGK